MSTAKNAYRKFKITEDMLQKDADLKLESTYELCSSELGLQQSKRDQIIAFYIAIVSFVVPAVTTLEVENWIKGVSFLALYVLGSMMCVVVNRYRLYKEVYWITCRVISQLYNFDPVKIDKTLIQGLFYKAMLKNAQSILQFKKGELEEAPANRNERFLGKKVSVYKTFKKMLNSAETTLFEVLVLMSTLVLIIGIVMFGIGAVGPIIVAGAAALLNVIYWNQSYYKRLTGVYATVVDGKDSSFNSTYAKAWFLHNYVDMEE